MTDHGLKLLPHHLQLQLMQAFTKLGWISFQIFPLRLEVSLCPCGVQHISIKPSLNLS